MPLTQSTNIPDIAISGSITAASGFAAITPGVPTNTAAAANSTVESALSGVGVVGIQIVGSWTGTIGYEASGDGTYWFPVNGIIPASGSVNTSTTANTIVRVNSAGYQQIRVRALGNSWSGTATIALTLNADASVIAATEITNLPTGSNTIGAVTQASGPWTTNQTQINGNAVATLTSGEQKIAVEGLAADGATASGNPVLVGGYDGSNAQTLLTDTSGRLIAVGAAASGASAVGNPVLVAGIDGSNNVKILSLDSSGNLSSTTTIKGGTGGVKASVRPDNRLSISAEQSAVLFESWDTPIDLSRWTQTYDVINVTPVATGNGKLTFSGANGGFGSGGWYKQSSQGSFAPEGGTLTLNFVIQLETGTPTSITRFWGKGTFIAGTPTAGSLVSTGIGFEAISGGGMQAAVYVSGTAQFTASVTKPSDGYYHNYCIQVRDTDITWYIDDMDNPVATLPLTNSNIAVAIVSSKTIFGVGAANGSTGSTTVVSAISTLINPARSLVLADPTYGHRRANVDSDGNLQVYDNAGFYGYNQRLRVGQPTLLFLDAFEGSALNTNLWTTSTVNYVIAVSNGAVNLNSTSLNAANNVATLISTKYIRFIDHAGIELSAKVRFTPPTSGSGEFLEIGFGAPSGTSVPTDGIFIRLNGASVGFSLLAEFNGVGNNLASATIGTDTSTNTLISYLNNNWLSLIMTVQSDSVRIRMYDYNNILQVDSIFPMPSGTVHDFFSTAHLPIFIRMFQTGTTTGVINLQVASVNVVQLDVEGNKDWADVSGSLQRNFAYKPDTFAQASNYPLSSAPGNSALSTSTPSLTTLGGIVAITNVVGAETDYPVISYQVPTGFSFVLTGIKIDGVVTTALTTTASTYLWGVGINGTANVLTSGSPIRIPIGVQGLLASAAVGTAVSNPIDHQFKTPLVVESGRYLHIILRVVTGAATGVVRWNVMPEGYFE